MSNHSSGIEEIEEIIILSDDDDQEQPPSLGTHVLEEQQNSGFPREMKLTLSVSLSGAALPRTSKNLKDKACSSSGRSFHPNMISVDKKSYLSGCALPDITSTGGPVTSNNLKRHVNYTSQPRLGIPVINIAPFNRNPNKQPSASQVSSEDSCELHTLPKASFSEGRFMKEVSSLSFDCGSVNGSGTLLSVVECLSRKAPHSSQLQSKCDLVNVKHEAGSSQPFNSESVKGDTNLLSAIKSQSCKARLSPQLKVDPELKCDVVDIKQEKEPQRSDRQLAMGDMKPEDIPSNEVCSTFPVPGSSQEKTPICGQQEIGSNGKQETGSNGKQEIETLFKYCATLAEDDTDCKLLDKMHSRILKYDEDYLNSEAFCELTKSTHDKLKRDPKNMHYHLKEYLDETLSCIKNTPKKPVNKFGKTKETSVLVGKLECGESSSSVQPGTTETSHATLSQPDVQASKKQRHIRKLEYMLVKCSEKIQKYEEREMSIDDLDKEDSTYLKIDTYKKRAMKIWKMICQLMEKSENAGRIVETKFRFEGSRYPEINRGLTRLVNRSKEFPDYADVLKVVNVCNKTYGLRLQPAYTEELARDLFLGVGKELKRRRILDFEEHFGCRVDETQIDNDPADKDQELNRALNQRRAEGIKKCDEVINTFVEKQLNLESQDIPKEDEISNEDDDDQPMVDVTCDSPENNNAAADDDECDGASEYSEPKVDETYEDDCRSIGSDESIERGLLGEEDDDEDDDDDGSSDDPENDCSKANAISDETGTVSPPTMEEATLKTGLVPSFVNLYDESSSAKCGPDDVQGFRLPDWVDYSTNKCQTPNRLSLAKRKLFTGEWCSSTPKRAVLNNPTTSEEFILDDTDIEVITLN